MTDKQKKIIAWASAAAVIIVLILLYLRNRRNAIETVNQQITPDQIDADSILSPMNYNIPPFNLGDRGPVEYGGLTFINTPASAFACGKNTYYSSQTAQAISDNGDSANEVAGREFLDLIDWNV